MDTSSKDKKFAATAGTTLRPALTVNRRDAILLGAASLFIVSCGSGGGDNTSTSTSGTSTTTDTTTTTSNGSCVISPEVTEGPYFVDEKLNRSDITADSDGSSVQSGVPLELQIHVYSVNGTACTALSGYQIDIWHASAGGLYSDISGSQGQSNSSTSGHNYLRGYQVTDSDGLVTFKTIYPGFYNGRTIHIHIKARLYDSSNNQTYEATTQMFFDDTINDQVLANLPYSSRGSRDTRNSEDTIYNNQTELLVALEADADNSGYVGTFNLGLDLN